MNGHSPRRQRRKIGGRGRRNQIAIEGNSKKKSLANTIPGNPELNLSPNKFGQSPVHSSKGSPRKVAKMTKGQDHKKVCLYENDFPEDLREIIIIIINYRTLQVPMVSHI